MSDDYMHDDKFKPADYVKVLSKIVKDPKSFYREKAGEKSIGKPAGVLVLSGLFFTAASVIIAMPQRALMLAVILFVNAVGMVLITAGIGYVVIALTQKRKVPYKELFGVYAYASGAVLTLAWMPFMIWIAEPWRWWLIGCGLTNKCGLGLKTSILIITLSLIILLLIFWLIPAFLMHG